MATFQEAIATKKAALAKSAHDFGSLNRTDNIVRGNVIIGVCNAYQYGTISSFTSNGKQTTAAIWGAIRQRWELIGGVTEANPVGIPVTDETTTPDKIGRFNHFTTGSIYWTPKTGAQFVIGSIRVRWSRMGWERNEAGYPLTGEIATPKPKDYGRFNHFQGGSIYWTPGTGAQWVPKDVFDHWATLGHERGEMGFPVDPGSAGLGRALVGADGVNDSVFFEGGYIQRLGRGKFATTFYDEVDFSKLNLTEAPFPIEIVYQGFHCLNESDVDQWGIFSGSSDEPYFFMGAFTALENAPPPQLKKFGVYQDVDSGNARTDKSSVSKRTLIRIEQGAKLTPIGVSIFAHEHDEGDDALRGPLGDAALAGLKTGAKYLGEAVTIGKTSGVAGGVAESVAGAHEKKALGWALGVRDDDIDVETRVYQIPELLSLAAENVRTFPLLGVQVNSRMELRNKDEGDYTIFFHVRRG